MTIRIRNVKELEKYLSDNRLTLQHNLPDEVVRESRHLQIEIILEEEETEPQYDIVVIPEPPYVCITNEESGKVFTIPLVI